MRLLLLGLACLCVLGTGCDDAGAESKLPPAVGDDAPPAPELPQLDASKNSESVKNRKQRYVGSLYAKDRVEAAAELSGTLSDVRFDVGDTVKKGEVLFRLNAKTAQLNLSRSRKGLDAATRQLEQAERDLARIQELFEAGAATKASLDAAKAARDSAEIAVEQADVGVDIGKSGISDTTTRAPIGGTVVERYKDPGEAVTSMPPTVVLVIEDQSVLELRFRVPELALRRIEVGTRVQAYVPALDIQREVAVTRIGSGVDPRTRTIEILANVSNEDGTLKPGMSVEVVPGDKTP